MIKKILVASALSSVLVFGLNGCGQNEQRYESHVGPEPVSVIPPVPQVVPVTKQKNGSQTPDATAATMKIPQATLPTPTQGKYEVQEEPKPATAEKKTAKKLTPVQDSKIIGHKPAATKASHRMPSPLKKRYIKRHLA